MSDKRRGLGRGLGALIPSSAPASASGNGAAPSRPVDLFFPEARKKPTSAASIVIEEDAAEAARSTSRNLKPAADPVATEADATEKPSTDEGSDAAA